MRRPELPALTGIRFYAAILVYLSHVPLIPGMGKQAGDNLIFNAGVVGVSFFFVLSGFILTYNYADTFRNGVSLVNYRRFVWDRLTKIYPVHVLALLLVMPIAVLSPNLPLDWRALPFHLLMLQCFWPASTPPFHDYFNVPSWSISCEWFFYLLAPMTMFFSVGTRRPWVLLALLASYAAGAWWLWAGQSDAAQLYFVSWFAPSRFVEFVVGVFLCRFYLMVKSAPPALSSLAQVFGVALIITGAVYRADAPWPLWGGILYVPGSVLLVLGLAYGRGLFARHLGHPVLRELGGASFSFYLLHAPILRGVKGVCLYLGWEVQSWVVFGAVAVGMLVTVQSIAMVVYHWYELPVQKRLRQWLRASSVQSASYAPQFEA